MSNTTEADLPGQADALDPAAGEQQADPGQTGQQGQIADEDNGVSSSEQKNLKRSREGEEVGGASFAKDGEKKNVNDGKVRRCPYLSRNPMSGIVDDFINSLTGQPPNPPPRETEQEANHRRNMMLAEVLLGDEDALSKGLGQGLLKALANGGVRKP